MRSSFKKFAQKPKFELGLPFIDQILGDIPQGSMILIKEDEFSRIHNILLNTFISEGIANNEKDVAIIGETDVNMNVYNLNHSQEVETDLKKMFIAWRYSDLKLDHTEYKFSLNTKGEFIGKKLITRSVNEAIEDLKQIQSHRIAMFSLFSASYNDIDIEKCLFELRKTVRQNNHICMVSIPSFLYEMVHFDLFFDVVISLKSNLMTGLLPNYRAIIELEKMSLYKGLRLLNLDSFILGLKFKKDKLIIENIDIPPDENEYTPSCPSF